MENENHNFDHPLDGQYDNAEKAGAELVSSVKKAGLKEAQLPIVDRNAVWAVSAQGLTIKDAGTQTPSLDPSEQSGPQSDLP